MIHDRRSGWVVRSDLEGVLFIPELILQDEHRWDAPLDQVYYRKPGGRGLYQATQIYRSERAALESLARQLEKQALSLEDRASDLHLQALLKLTKLEAVRALLGRAQKP